MFDVGGSPLANGSNVGRESLVVRPLEMLVPLPQRFDNGTSERLTRLTGDR